jgi:cytochrome P450
MGDHVRTVTTVAGDPAWLVGGHARVRRLLTDRRLGRTHPDPQHAARYSDSVIFGRPQPASATEDADDARMRRLLTPWFSPRRMAVLRPRVQELVDGLLDDLGRATPPVDFHEAVSFPLPALVICELLGVPYEDREDFRRWSDDAADMTDEGRSMSGLGALWQYIQQLVDAKRADPSDDLLSELATVEASSEGVAELGAGLLFAGHETTVAAIDTGLVLLLDDRARFDALIRDPSLLDASVEEILRLPAPVPEPEVPAAVGLPRWANAELDVDGTSIHAGELVLLDLESANLDPAVFDAPCAFDPSRPTNPHLTFGHGPHYCIGAPLARLELQVLFATLARRFPTLALAVPPTDLRPRSHLLTAGLESLPVTW